MSIILTLSIPLSKNKKSRSGPHGVAVPRSRVSVRPRYRRERTRTIVATIREDRHRPPKFFAPMVETKSPANPLFLRDEELRQGIELMFYAYRDFTFESDQQLKRYHLGRAHHRALYFIGRHPGQTVGHLLSILKVTKQAVSRVLKDLLERGYVEQRSGPVTDANGCYGSPRRARS